MKTVQICVSIAKAWSRPVSLRCDSSTTGVSPKGGAAPEDGTPDLSSRRRRRTDFFYLFALIASLGGLALISNDVLTIRSGRPGSAGDLIARSGDTSFPAPSDLNNWTEELAACARPGPQVRSFVSSFPGSPAEKMAAIYVRIVQRWQYEPDGERDWFTPAEVLVQPGMMRGDCKQIATLLYASAVELGITARMVATSGHDKTAGHVHTEILLCRPQEEPTETLEVMGAVWKAVLGRNTHDRPDEYPLTWTAQGVFLTLDGGLTPSKYQQPLGPVESIISSSR